MFDATIYEKNIHFKNPCKSAQSVKSVYLLICVGKRFWQKGQYAVAAPSRSDVMWKRARAP